MAARASLVMGAGMTARANRVRDLPPRRDAIHIVREQRPNWPVLAKRLGTALALALFWGSCMYVVVRHAL